MVVSAITEVWEREREGGKEKIAQLPSRWQYALRAQIVINKKRPMSKKTNVNALN